MQFLLFQIDKHILALPVDQVKRVIQAAALSETLLGGGNILGVINVQGKIIPIVNTRKTLNIKNKELSPEDQFILCEVDDTVIGLCVDHTENIIDCSSKELIKEVGGLPVISSLIKLANQVIYIYNLEALMHNKDDGDERRDF